MQVYRRFGGLRFFIHTRNSSTLWFKTNDFYLYAPARSSGRFNVDTVLLHVPPLIVCRGRGVAGGVCAAGFYIVAFLVSKTWVNLINAVDLHGCFLFYGLVAAVGVVFVYYCLPETEGKTLAEIEMQIASKRTGK